VHLLGDAQGSLAKVPWVGRLPLSSHHPALERSKTPLARGGTFLPTEAMGPWQGCLLQTVIDGGTCPVSISVMSVPGKASLRVKIHHKQKVKREKSPFPLNKEK